MWTVQCTLYTVSTFLSSASSSSSVHDEILFYLERIKFLFISINIRISFIFLFPIQCYHEYGNIWSQDCFLHVWETLKYDCSFLSIKCSSCIHSKESFMSATIRMGKITLRLLKKTICNGMGEGEVALYQYDLPGLFLLLSQIEDSINL